MEGMLSALVYAAASAVTLGQMDRATPVDVQGQGARDQTVSRRVGSTDEDVHITAEDVLKALRERRPSNRIVTPSRMGGGPPPTNLHPLYPDGSMLTETAGTLSQDGDWWIFRPDDADSPMPTLKVLSNAALEGMVRTVRGSRDAVRFRVSGELTEFQRENYLLPRVAARLRTADAQVAVTGANRRNGQAARADDADDAPAPIGADASADEVLELLSARGPSERLVDIRESQPEPEPDDTIVTSSGATVAGLMPDGTPLVERPGRLTRRGNDWIFVFESDHPDHPEPPMQLLLNRNVELMVQAAAQDSTGLVFMVSGEVTVYNGQNYLLPRVARRVITSGNLRK